MPASSPTAPAVPVPDFATARYHMVECQIRPNKVTDTRILDIMGALPREAFAPPALAGIAYIDEDLPVGRGRYLLEPMVLARLLQEAGITRGDRVLDIAPATGYSTAAIASLAREVVALESDARLAEQAQAALDSLGILNVVVGLGDMAAGAPGEAPYDVIIVNGGMDRRPDRLLEQLKEGGRLLGVIRRFGPAHAAHFGEAMLFEKIHGSISGRPLFDANVHLLPGFEARPSFVF